MKSVEEIVSEVKFASLIVPLDNSKRDLVFDTECDNLLIKVTKMYVIVAQDYKTREFYVFSNYNTYGLPKHGSLEEGVNFLASARSLIAHNIAGYDWYVLNKFFPVIFNKKSVPWKMTHDTLIQSKAQWYDRPARKGVKGCHGLAYYGDLLGYPKPPIDDWSFWDKEKLTRCIVDVEINTRTLDYLNQEKAERAKMGIDFSWQTNIAKYTQYWCAQQEINGVRGNRALMQEHVKTLDVMIEELRLEVEPQLPMKLRVKAAKATWEEVRDKWEDFFRSVPATQYEKAKRSGEIIDAPVKESYFPTTKWRSAPNKVYPNPTKFCTKPKANGSYKYSKAVCDWYNVFPEPEACDFLVEGDFCKVDYEKLYKWKYDTHTAKWFDIDIDPEKSNYLVGGVYTKVYHEPVTLTQHAEVKDFLLTLGWVPTEYNNKKDVYGQYMKDEKGAFVKGSPKLTEDSFDSLPEGIGQSIASYNTYMHRRRTILNDDSDEKGWLNQLDENDRLHAGANVFATSTGRHAQSGAVNVPSAAAKFGAQMREVWVASEGCNLISTDMDSAQLMIIAGYMEDERFIKAVREGEEFREYDEKPERYYEITGDGKYKVYIGTDAHTVNSVYFTLNKQEDIDMARKTQDKAIIHKVTNGRKRSKNSVYAYLFGASDRKFATTAGLRTAADGKRVKETYEKNLPKLGQLKQNLEKQFDTHKVGSGGYIQIAGGVWLFCNSKHKILNFLAQGVEAQVQNCAIIWKCSMYEKEGIPARQLLTIHDEQTDECPVEYTERVKEIQSRMYYEASKILKLKEPVTGDAVVGKTWLEVH